ncbi:MAG: LAGLIDADG family homing endonuclease [Nanoarchaeota archaeon]|nr:LAGLIDADG family homing endonuclease [Nanoarchaeota archaeon]
MKRRIHVWDLPINKIYIQLSPEFREYFFKRIHNHFGSWRLVGDYVGMRRGDSTICINWRKGMNCYPLSTILELSETINISKRIIEENIIEIKYKTKLNKRGGNSGKSLYNPKFPIKINEYFVEILGHICGDGSIPTKTPHKGIKTIYVNSQPELIKEFKTFVQDVFGDIEPKCYTRDTIGYRRPNYSLNYPSIISIIILSVFDYKVDSEMLLPEFISELTNKEKSKFLRAIFDDEGTVYLGTNKRNIKLGMKPKLVVIGICNLLRDLDIYPSRIYTPENGMHNIEISGKSNIIKFSQRIGFKHPIKEAKLKKVINLGWKFERIPPNETKEKIIGYLDGKDFLSRKQIQNALDLTRYVISQRLLELEEDQIIEKKRIILRDKDKNINIISNMWRLK